jgi:hypothetical protein
LSQEVKQFVRRSGQDLAAGSRPIVTENLAATNVAISADEVAYLADVLRPGRIVGERYAPGHFAHIKAAQEH